MLCKSSLSYRVANGLCLVYTCRYNNEYLTVLCYYATVSMDCVCVVCVVFCVVCVHACMYYVYTVLCCYATVSMDCAYSVCVCVFVFVLCVCVCMSYYYQFYRLGTGGFHKKAEPVGCVTQSQRGPIRINTG